MPTTRRSSRVQTRGMWKGKLSLADGMRETLRKRSRKPKSEVKDEISLLHRRGKNQSLEIDTCSPPRFNSNLHENEFTRTSIQGTKPSPGQAIFRSGDSIVYQYVAGGFGVVHRGFPSKPASPTLRHVVAIEGAIGAGESFWRDESGILRYMDGQPVTPTYVPEYHSQNPTHRPVFYDWDGNLRYMYTTELVPEGATDVLVPESVTGGLEEGTYSPAPVYSPSSPSYDPQNTVLQT